jgi:DNA replication protein DnaC
MKQELYKCNICKDTGWIMQEQTESQPTMKRCECYKMEKAKRLWINAGINIEQSRQTFSAYTTWNETSRRAKETAISYCNNFDKIKSTRNNSIAFIGQVGSGKTHLSLALAINFLSKGLAVVYMPYRDVITKIKQNMIDEEYYKKTLSKFQTCKILLVDDLFKGSMKNGKPNETDINIMFEIINYRYLNNLPLIISSEYIADQLLDFDEAVGSRILQMCKSFTVQIEGRENNYRLK